jgi:uncharacterized membrane protein
MFCYSHGVSHNPAARVSIPTPVPPSNRLDALDALRGLSILLMVFSGRIPFGVLPDWMYHAQVPPPNHVFDPTLPGITWVDLVFPFFLFAMGAAIPFALRRRIDRGETPWKLSAYIVQRGLLLAAFAIYVMHIRPWLFGENPGTVAGCSPSRDFCCSFQCSRCFQPDGRPAFGSACAPEDGSVRHS